MHIPGYAIKRKIGKGGMASVYLAIQESLDRAVVLKMLDQARVKKSLGMVERFIAEGRILAALVHPNIITIYDIGIADNQLYISMEYVQGGDLRRRMKSTITPEQALDYLIKIASALGKTHEHGIIHRDVKPANILFKDNDTPLLTDFGIAKQLDTDSSITSVGTVLGSPAYISPEQAEGVKIDVRTDIYSLGCIFYEMLMREQPYVSRSIIDLLIQHKRSPVPSLSNEFKTFQPLLNKMMAKKRDQRFHNVESLVTELERLREERQHNPPLTAASSSIKGKTRPGGNRARQILTGLLFLALVMFATLKYVDLKFSNDSPIKATTRSVLDEQAIVLPEARVQTETAEAAIFRPGQTPAQVTEALLWLGRQSLEKFKLTYPHEDNAYYYFSRLLELDPGNQAAIDGIYEIPDRYAILAEQSLAKNELEKMTAYADIGLRINPDHEALLAIKSLAASQDHSLMTTIKNLFK